MKLLRARQSVVIRCTLLVVTTPFFFEVSAFAQNAQIAAAAAPAEGLQEIIVTAQRRREDIQKSSIPITALSGDSLEKANLTQIQDLSNLVPDVNISFEGAQSQIYVRGVGTFAANSLADESVAVNVDQVNIARPSGLGGMFFDIDRIEVLKGPQGTLYGRNASGGAINIVTNDPQFDRVGGSVTVTEGNYGATTTEGAVNLPFNDVLAVRGAFQTAKHEGYLSDGTDDEDQQSGRIKALLRPSDAFSILASADYAHLGGKGAGAADFPALDPDDPWIGQADPRSNAVKVAGTAIFLEQALHLPPFIAAQLAQQAANPANDFLDYHPWGVSLDSNADLGFATLSVIPAYRSTDGSYNTHSGTFGFDVTERDRTESVEARLSNSTERLKWTAGTYYFNEHQSYTSLANTEPVSTSFSDIPKLNDENWAGFGQITYALVDRLRAIGGVRYTHESKDIAGTGYNQRGAGTPVQRVVTGNKDWNDTNWKAGLEYDVAPESMAYVTASTGFKAGGFGLAGNAVIPYDPEHLTAYELGIKNRFFDDTLQVNLEGFYWDYKNHQEALLGPSPQGGGVAYYTVNAGSATLDGFDLGVIYKLTRVDTLTIDAEFNHSKYNTFVYNENVGYANPANNGCGIGASHEISVGGNTVPVNSIDCSGKQLDHAPLWSGTMGLQHVFDLHADSTLTAAVSSRFSSAIWGAVDFIPNERLPSYTQTNLYLTYVPPAHRWSLTLYAKNLEDSAAYTNAFQAQFVAGLVAASILPPRTYGVQATVNF